MPDGIKWIPMEEILTLEEIADVVSCGVSLGLKSIRLTGGEPLTRKGLISLVRLIKNTEGINRVSMTTNGVLLKENLPSLIEAGLDSVNISLDTLDRDRYREISGSDALPAVLSAIDSAFEAGIQTKINVVSMDFVEEELPGMLELIRERDISLRFIEMMPIGLGRSFPVYDHRDLLFRLKELYPGLERDTKFHGSGPAVYYRIPGFKGSVGLISSIHVKFCDSCNRVRLTSRGFLKTCLCYAEGTDLKMLLRSGLPDTERNEKIISAMKEAILNKPRFHCFESVGDITESAFMNGIGG